MLQRGLVVPILVESLQAPRPSAISEKHGLIVIVDTSTDTIAGEQVSRSLSLASQLSYGDTVHSPIQKTEDRITQTYGCGTARLSRFTSIFENSGDLFQHRRTR